MHYDDLYVVPDILYRSGMYYGFGTKLLTHYSRKSTDVTDNINDCVYMDLNILVMIRF